MTCVFSQPNNMKMKIPLMLASLILSMTSVSSEDADLWIKELRVKTGYEHNAGMDGCCVRFVIYNKVLHTHCSKDIIFKAFEKIAFFPFVNKSFIVELSTGERRLCY